MNAIINKKDILPTIKNIDFKSKSTGIENQITKIMNSYFNQLSNEKIRYIISEPIFTNQTNKLVVEVYYFESVSRVSIRMNGKDEQSIEINIKEDLKKIAQIFSKVSSKEVSFIFTRVHYPYMNATIFAKYLFSNSNGYTFIHFQDAITKYPRFSKEINQFDEKVSFEQMAQKPIRGIKVEVTGRLSTEKVIPRVTKKSKVFGAISGSKFIEYGHYTGKNYLGSFTIKVWIGIE